MEQRSKRTSFFWPILLIGAGILLLLRNLGFLQNFNFGFLLNLWPLLLVVIGLDLIFGRRFPWAGAVIGLFTIGAVVALFYYAPALGINSPPAIKTELISTPLGNTEKVEYHLYTSNEPVVIKALTDSTDLIDATLVHRDELNFTVEGDANKVVTLSESRSADNLFSIDLGQTGLKWEIGLHPDVPTSLNLEGGSGALDIDLTGMKLESFSALLGSGATTLTLPVSATAYPVEVTSGSGGVTMTLPAATEVTLTLISGSGAINILVPEDSPLSVEVLDDGSGNVYLPADLELLNGDGSFSNDTWQSPDFPTAPPRLVIRIIGRGSGSISINHTIH